MIDPPTSSDAPSLQPPGAGLPWWELLLIRYFVFPRACRILSWESAGKLFQDEGTRILAVWDTLPAERLGERVLIRRIAGIEDSSRYWSAAMTVEHLNVVGTGIIRTISKLRQGEVPDRRVRIEDVKPRGEEAPSSVRSTFIGLLAEVTTMVADYPPMRGGDGPRYAHPWFGPIDAFHWYCLLGLHQGIHRKQIEAIREGLGSS